MATTEPTTEETLKLFRDLEHYFPSENLGEGKWEILAIAAISTGGHPERAANLYEYLIAKPKYQTPAQRQALVRRLREALLKLVSVVGVPKPLKAVFAIGAIEKEQDRDYSFTRENWQRGEANTQRGRQWLSEIYRHNLPLKNGALSHHKDFEWISVDVTYGLYLSDHSILDGVDTQLVTLSGIMLQNLKRETGWHLRGTRRVGVSAEDVERIQQCIEKVATFCGLQLTRVPRVADIEHEV